ncbi:MAG: hypothetical protein EOP83_30810 [Verrucomicrobiaceae bacterium]|nr:MAG: hypothetical protein EOP83_30810 [Verrucomicrobiaceae bacterium]
MTFIIDPVLRHQPWVSPFNYNFVAKKGVALEVIAEVRVWCHEQFGPQRPDRWECKGWRFDFVGQADATAFKIRWG